MKPGLIAILAFFIVMNAVVAQHSLQPLWKTDSVLAIPESVLYDAQHNLLYVSLIDGQGNTKDGKGGVAKLSPEGKIIDTLWITGLNAPKGLGKHGNTLYAADLDEVVEIDIAKSKVIRKIPVPHAIFLNDITVDDKGIVYVSDTRTNKVFCIKNGVPEIYIDNITSPNGLLALNNKLYVLSAGSLVEFDADKKPTVLFTGMEKSTDGLVATTPGNFIASAWIGVIYSLQAGQQPQVLIDTRSIKKNTADIEYNAASRVLYVPTFNGKSVDGYRVN
ncbi:SMP-30/gluconolactonase/LRE family protein [Deminuibacter soli]|uniref:ATP/GTP-binding protein n=1 Tax=Deminuibacter soli TaxID=2291815 RepID=A0A3E1NI63_9BACT|nr:ATP/GTP-binding protein [Deminuibacter soli]RFM27561.1 ATP/GTP-binding protein [Deminuibacter soli]